MPGKNKLQSTIFVNNFQTLEHKNPMCEDF